MLKMSLQRMHGEDTCLPGYVPPVSKECHAIRSRGYDECMSAQAPKRKSSRRLLYVLLGSAVVLLLAMVAVIVVPILTHQSAGGSGQQLPSGYVSQSEAKGADERTRSLSVETTDGKPADMERLEPGQVLVVRGSGYDPNIGIYVSICKVPDQPGEKPSPCLGGLPEGAMEGEAAGSEKPMSSFWITGDWAWKAFANKNYDDPKTGSFEVQLMVPPASQDGLDCATQQCAVTTRADHTAATDRVQDMMLPVKFG